MSIYDEFKDNLERDKRNLQQDVWGEKVVPRDPDRLLNHLKIIFPYFCRHPQDIIDELDALKEDGLKAIINELYDQTYSIPKTIRKSITTKLTHEEKTEFLNYYQENEEGKFELRSPYLPGNEQLRIRGLLEKAGYAFIVWQGNIGEAIATAYVKSFTNYSVPIFKLRLPASRKVSMPGDDLLGFQFHEDGSPRALLIAEVKNYLSNPSTALANANQTLLHVKKTKPTLLQFVITALYEKKMGKRARLIKRFLPKYPHDYQKAYLAFIVTDTTLWKDAYFQKTEPEPATPLKIVSFLVPDWKNRQQQILATHAEEDLNFDFPAIEVDEVEEIQTLVENADFQRDQKILASAALSSDLKIHGRAYQFDPIKIESAAQFLAYSALEIFDEETEKAQEYLKQAGRIYERLAIWQIGRGKNDNALRSIFNGGFLYSIAGYNANANVLIQKLNHIRVIEELYQNCPWYVFLNYLFVGNLAKLQDSLAAFFLEFAPCDGDDARLEEDQWLELIGENLSKIGNWLVAKAFVYLVAYLKTGDEQWSENVREYLVRASNQYYTIGYHEAYNITFLLKKYMQSLIANSTQKWLSAHITPVDEEWRRYLNFLSTLGKFPMLTLWRSQQKAVQQGLLEDKSLFLTMPTSAGKTRMVEIAIYKARREHPNGICVYVVPTRALAYEVENSLSKNLTRMGIGVALLYGGYDFGAFEQKIIEQNQVFVLTPEKLDLLLRNQEEFKNNIVLVIIDEAHEAAQPGVRGLRTEFIFSRLFYIAEKNGARILALSAVIRNPVDFAKWITGEEENIIKITWRPTDRKFGQFQWGSYNNAIIRYSRNANLSGDFFVPLQFNKKVIKDNASGNIEIAARLGLYYAETGSTLIFTSTKTNVEKIVDNIAALVQKSTSIANAETDEITDACERILGPEHKLVQTLKVGCCYHHAALPHAVKKIIEDGVRDNIIPLIVSTTTLAAGVNLPIKNVIVHSLWFGGQNTLSMTKFFNIIGRAGRAGQETEGHIIFCEPKDLKTVIEKQHVETSESFITSGLRVLLNTRFPSLGNIEDFVAKWAMASTDNYRKETYIPQSLTINQYKAIVDRLPDEKHRKLFAHAYYSKNGKHNLSKYLSDTDRTKLEQVLTSINHDLTSGKLKNAEKEQREILSTFDSQLLAWIMEMAVEEVSDETVDTILQKLLFHVQPLEVSDITEQFKSGMKRRAIAVKDSITETTKRTIFNRTGLGVKSNHVINDYAQKVANHIEDFDTPTLSREFWNETYTVFSEIPEFAKSLNVNVDVLLDWIHGNSYKQIADTYYDSNIEKAVKAIERMTYSLPWGLNSLTQHLSYYIKESNIPTIFTNLSSLAFHGVPDVISVYAINMGITDREVAMFLSQSYMDNNESQDYNTFKTWLLNLDSDAWNEIFQSTDIAQHQWHEQYENVLDKFGSIADIAHLMEFVVEGELLDNGIKPEDFSIVQVGNDFWLTTLDYEKFWKLTGENIEVLAQVDRQLQAVVVDAFSEDRRSLTIGGY